MIQRIVGGKIPAGRIADLKFDISKSTLKHCWIRPQKKVLMGHFDFHIRFFKERISEGYDRECHIGKITEWVPEKVMVLRD